MKNARRKLPLVIAGFLQGVLGTYWAIFGWMLAFPATSPGARDYEEDMTFVPLGYLMMLIWIAVMVSAIVLLRKNKPKRVSFFLSWIVGLIGILLLLLML